MEAMILNNKFKNSLVQKCASKVLESLKNVSGNIVKLAALKDDIPICVKGLGWKEHHMPMINIDQNTLNIKSKITFPYST